MNEQRLRAKFTQPSSQRTSHGDINALTVFDVDRPGTSGQREAPRCGGRHAEPALVGDGVDEHGHGIVGVGVELDDAGGEGGRGSGGVEADAEESEERERARVTFIQPSIHKELTLPPWEPICGDGLDRLVLAFFFNK